MNIQNKSSGFTLIELLVTIVIIGVLSGVALPSFLNQVRRARISEAENALSILSKTFIVAAFDCNTYNLTLADLESGNLACDGPDASNGWLEQSWSQLAPNYDLTISNATNTGATLSADGSSPGYNQFNAATYPQSLVRRVGN